LANKQEPELLQKKSGQTSRTFYLFLRSDNDDAVNRAVFHAPRRIKVVLAIHADGFVNDVDVFAFRNGVYGAFRFAGAAVDALFINPVWHFLLQGYLGI
jgi:hypothetical protein